MSRSSEIGVSRDRVKNSPFRNCPCAFEGNSGQVSTGGCSEPGASGSCRVPAGVMERPEREQQGDELPFFDESFAAQCLDARLSPGATVRGTRARKLWITRVVHGEELPTRFGDKHGAELLFDRVMNSPYLYRTYRPDNDPGSHVDKSDTNKQSAHAPCSAGRLKVKSGFAETAALAFRALHRSSEGRGKGSRNLCCPRSDEQRRRSDGADCAGPAARPTELKSDRLY